MKYKVNISIDDISPHPRSSIGVINRCFELLEWNGSIKFTLFVPMAFTRLNEESYDISDYPYFCDYLRKLPQSNFELGWHGYYHGIIGKSNNDEFRYLGYDDAMELLKKMFNKAQHNNLSFSPIFRPSAFRMSPSVFRACLDSGIKILAISDRANINLTYEKQDKEE